MPHRLRELRHLTLAISPICYHSCSVAAPNTVGVPCVKVWHCNMKALCLQTRGNKIKFRTGRFPHVGMLTKMRSDVIGMKKNSVTACAHVAGLLTPTTFKEYHSISVPLRRLPSAASDRFAFPYRSLDSMFAVEHREIYKKAKLDRVDGA